MTGPVSSPVAPTKAPMVRASTVRMIATLGAALGLDPAELLARAGFGPRALQDPEVYIPGLSARRVWLVLAEMLPGRAVGLELAAIAPLRLYGALGYALRHSPDIRSGLDTIARFIGIVSTHARVELLPTGKGLAIRLHHHPAIEEIPHIAEFGLAMNFLHGLGGRASTGDVWAVRFKHARTGPAESYVKTFGRLPEFKARHSEIVVGPAILARPTPESDPELFAAINRSLEAAERNLLPDLDADITASVALCASRGRFQVAALADTLEISPRSLHRRLKPRGISARKVLERARRNTATQMLADPGIAIPEIAFLLGYSDERAFNRAFKRWTGHTPAQFRRAQR